MIYEEFRKYRDYVYSSAAVLSRASFYLHSTMTLRFSPMPSNVDRDDGEARWIPLVRYLIRMEKLQISHHDIQSSIRYKGRLFSNQTIAQAFEFLAYNEFAVLLESGIRKTVDWHDPETVLMNHHRLALDLLKLE